MTGALMKYLGIIPLIAVVIVFYNFVALGTSIHVPADGSDPMRAFLNTQIFSLPMVSKETLIVTVGDAFVMAALLSLLQEIVRATSTSNIELINHGVSFALFVIALIEFLLIKGFATATFLILILMTFVDVIAGFIIGLAASRREVEISKQ